MDLEALLLGIEPVTVLTVGIATIVLAPVVTAVGSVVVGSNISESVSASAREFTKNGLVLGFDALDSLQKAFAETQAAFRDVFAEAMIEHMANKSQPQTREPRRIEIVSE